MAGWSAPAAADPCGPETTILESLTRAVDSAAAFVTAHAPVRDPFDFTSRESHEVRVLDQGVDSLLTRLELIESATTSIEIAAYEMTDDQGGRLLLQALARASKERGVNVRILMDRYVAPGKSIIGQELARELAKAGVTVRYYNTAEWTDPLTRTRRNHRKMLIVDDRRLVTGGRNWSDEYWDLAYGGFSFMDRDVLVEGPGVAAAAKSADLHHAHEWSVSAADAFTDVPIDPAAVSRAKDSLRTSAGDIETLAQVKKTAAAQRALSKTHTAPRVTFVSDKPGEAGPGVMRCHDALMNRISAAKKTVVIETYDFFPGAESEKAFAELAKKNVKLAVLTNSPATESNPMVAAYAHESARRLVKAGADVYGMGGWESPDHVDPRPAGTYSFWGTHAKTIVIDSKDVIIGSFNFDPRSARLNTEMGFVIDSPALAVQIAEAFEREVPDRAYRVRLTSDGHLEWIERVGPEAAESCSQQLIPRRSELAGSAQEPG